MKIGTRRRIRIIDRAAQLMTTVVMVGLTFWGLMLYLQYEWIMIEWPW